MAYIGLNFHINIYKLKYCYFKKQLMSINAFTSFLQMHRGPHRLGTRATISFVKLIASYLFENENIVLLITLV